MMILGYLSYGVRHPTVLDMGCGHGRLLQLLTPLGFANYLGVDISREAVDRAQSLSIPNTRFVVADFNQWRTDELFDAVVLNECLVYAVNPHQLFERVIGWLTETGIVVVSMFRQDPRASRIWSLIESSAIESLASSTVTDHLTGHIWDIRAMRLQRLGTPIGVSSQKGAMAYHPADTGTYTSPQETTDNGPGVNPIGVGP